MHYQLLLSINNINLSSKWRFREEIAILQRRKGQETKGDHDEVIAKEIDGKKGLRAIRLFQANSGR